MNKRILLPVLMAFGLGAFMTACNKGGTPASAPAADKAAAGATAAKAAVGDSDLIPVGDSYTKGGGADALVTIIEFSDFQCPFCSRVNPTLKQIKDKYGDKVRVAFKHNPLPFHKDAPLASKYALAAGKQGKFWEMHDKLFENQRALKAENLDGYAKELGLNLDQLKKDAEGMQKAIDADMALAAKVGARGTPNFLINGKQLAGAQPLDRFTAVIDEEITAAEALIKAGTAKNAVYAARVKANFKAPAAKPAGNNGPSDSTVYKIPVDPKAYAKGGSEPLVTILEFSEFQCPFCNRVGPTVKQIMDTYKDDVRIVFMHNPLPFHKDAMPASEAALAAGEQGKFWEMHDKLFANQKALGREQLEGYAQELGLDMAKFKSDMDSGKFKAVIQANQKIAQQFGARGTPNFFVNGRQITGARPFEAFKSVIDEEIKKAKDLISKGTPRGQIYAKVTEKGLTKAAAPAPSKRNPRAQDTTTYKVPVNAADAVKGPNDALITIIEFSDFQCPFCSRVNPTIDGLTKKYGDKIRVVFKHNPLPFHKEAPLASEAALAAGEQGKFWEMHDKLFANQKALKRENLDSYAKEIGLDMSKFAAALDGGKFKAQVKADMDLARQIGAGGTPNFFINGRKLVGAQPQASFEALIDSQLKVAEGLVAKGTAKSAVYAEIIKNGATKPSAPAAAPAQDDTTIYPVKVNPEDAAKGGKDAVVTIVEFSDFQCPFCGRVNPTLKQVQDKYGDKVKIVFKHNPLSFHKDAPLASEAALAAHAQGKFWEMHDMLFKNQRALKRTDLERYAQELGLNLSTFKADLDSNKYKAQVDADMAEARKHGASGTPTFFINGRKLRGAQPYPSFEKLIDEALAKKK